MGAGGGECPGGFDGEDGAVGFVGEDVVEAVAVDGAHVGCGVGVCVVEGGDDGCGGGVEVFAVVDSLWGEVPVVEGVGIEIVLDA